MLSALLWVFLGVLWVVWALFARALMRAPQRLGDPYAGMFMWVLWAYTRWFQRVRYEGLEHVPGDLSGGQPTVVVANHTAGVDPVLIQNACGFEVRWMMAGDMMSPRLRALWDWAGLIEVDRSEPRGDAGALREALAQLERGGCVGIFPEGRIAKPTGTILRFEPGVGLMIRRSGARVLQAVIEGTPECETAYASLWRRGRARVRFLEMKDYSGTKLGSAEIALELEERLAQATGWRREETRNAE